jgi:hypothetical protein
LKGIGPDPRFFRRRVDWLARPFLAQIKNGGFFLTTIEKKGRNP